MRRRLTADGSSSLRTVSESCHHSPSTGPRRPSVSIALRSFWLIARTSAGLVAGSYRTEVSPSRSLGSFEPFAWRMNVRRMPSAPPNSPASNTTLSRGDAWPDWDASVVVQSSWANTNAAKSTSWESSTSRSRVDRPGLNVVVQGSTSATSSSPRVIAWTSLACLPDDPRKMRGLFMRDSPFRSRDEGQRTRLDPVDHAGNTGVVSQGAPTPQSSLGRWPPRTRGLGDRSILGVAAQPEGPVFTEPRHDRHARTLSYLS